MSTRPRRSVAAGCVGALLATSCAMPPQMKIENANHPRHEDKDVRFRTTYYFRVYDPCPPASGTDRPPASDTLYRFRMTGKAKSLTNQVHFEAGTLAAAQIDPLGASVAYDERNRQFYLKSPGETQEEARRERDWTQVQRLLDQYWALGDATSAAAARAAAQAASAAGGGAAAAAAASAAASAASAAAGTAQGLAAIQAALQAGIANQFKKLAEGAIPAQPAASAPASAGGADSTAGSKTDKARMSDCAAHARGFQILGPEGWRVFNQNERLLMAMSSSGKPLISTMQEVAGRVLNDQPVEAEMLLPLVREDLRITRAERELDRYDRSKPEAGADTLKAVIEQLQKEFGK